MVAHTLNGWYDKNVTCRKKIIVDIFSLYWDISFNFNQNQKITLVDQNGLHIAEYKF